MSFWPLVHSPEASDPRGGVRRKPHPRLGCHTVSLLCHPFWGGGTLLSTLFRETVDTSETPSLSLRKLSRVLMVCRSISTWPL